ncbi:competence type IV pilus minor pilin ComGD [Virgibacillus flavescens]|uniref:competence type IV pilus minor pilin ComGD n=1 Tax=Virgibacillus flavescens TaxID=1611422 RepID=UPI003D344664
MQNKNGFTLIEMILVLGVLAVCILLSPPIKTSIIDNQKEKQFLTTFENDLLFMQSISYLSAENFRMEIKTDTYVIIGRHQGDLFLSRSIPKGWVINRRTIQSGIISFNQNGTIRQPGTIQLVTKRSTYTIVFPLGKGRCYIEKQ